MQPLPSTISHLRSATSRISLIVLLFWASGWGCGASGDSPRTSSDLALRKCDAGNGGITLPAGFCATVFADNIGVARHLVIAPTGEAYVALEEASVASANATSVRGEKGRGAIVILRDTSGDGRADTERRIATAGGTGIALRDGSLWFSTSTAVLRYTLSADRLGFDGKLDTIVKGIPDGGHVSRSLALDDSGHVFVNVGSDGNACRASRDEKRGADPCPQLLTRAGVWRYEANRKGQSHPADGLQWATGIRNAVALAWNPVDRALYAASHGRDGLATLWPQLYTAAASAEKPSEEFMRVARGENYGWPYCFHDPELNTKVLAPEYGGDGRRPGRCSNMAAPMMGFPGHWGPNALLFYTETMFPERYRGGAFIAFHGSWNRQPLPEAGYKVVFVPFRDGRPLGAYETFADGFAAGEMEPVRARHRPTGLAQAADGALYISDDQRGRIWRVTWRGP